MDSRLIGAWSLISFTRTDITSGVLTYPYGFDAQGSIIYSPDGIVSYQLCAANRATFQSGSFENGSPEELAAAALSFRSYVAHWTTDPLTNIVSHSVFLSIHANRVGVTLERQFFFEDYEFEGKTTQHLILIPVSSSGSTNTDIIQEKLTWARVSAPPTTK